MDLVEATILARGQQRWFGAVTGRFKGKLRILRSKSSRRRDEILQLFEITVDERLKTKLLRYLKNDPDISELAITHSSQGRLVGLMRARGTIMRCIADSDCFLVQASNDSRTEIEWKVLGTNRSLKNLMAHLSRKKVEYRVRDISEVKVKKGLTARQEWLLRSAYEHGYFDSPKGTHLRALAGDLRISAPTLFESLRKTERKLLEEHFEGDRSLPLAGI